MFPIPFEQFIPKFFERDSKLTAFADKMDSIIEYLKEDLLNMQDIYFAEKVPRNVLNELGYMFAAGFVATDSDQIKRKKLYYAISGHKLRGSFNLDAKPKIDSIAGGDSKIYRAIDSSDWILGGDGIVIDPSYYWATMGCDGIDDDLGLSLIGEGIEIEVAGNIYIDVDNPSLTSDEQEQIRVLLETDIVPAYMKVHIGYENISGQFIEYFVMG